MFCPVLSLPKPCIISIYFHWEDLSLVKSFSKSLKVQLLTSHRKCAYIHLSWYQKNNYPNANPIPSNLQRLPKIIGIKIPRKLLIHIQHMHIPLAIIPNHRPRPLPILLVPLNINPQAPIHFES